jgi:hypothetical protein
MTVHGSTSFILSRFMAVHGSTLQYMTGFAPGGPQADFGALLKALHCMHYQWQLLQVIPSSHCMHKLVYSSSGLALASLGTVPFDSLRHNRRCFGRGSCLASRRCGRCRLPRGVPGPTGGWRNLGRRGSGCGRRGAKVGRRVVCKFSGEPSQSRWVRDPTRELGWSCLQCCLQGRGSQRGQSGHPESPHDESAWPALRQIHHGVSCKQRYSRARQYIYLLRL